MESRKYTEELHKIDSELVEIDSHINELKQKRRRLQEKKIQIERALELRTADLEGTAEKWESECFSWSKDLRQALRTHFKLDSFRPLQLSAINAILSKEDALLIMSTGGGKSLCYQLPALISSGLTLVVSPLLSLMEDQVMALRGLGLDCVAMLNANVSKEELQRVQTQMTDAHSSLRLLYVTPEKLAKSKRFMNKLEKVYELGRLQLIAIDEVHCCSQWGHDFRPDYKFLNVIRRQFRSVPILGLTATATSAVLDDVKEMLGIQGALVFRAGFNRPNLFYELREKPADKEQQTADLVSLIKERFPAQSGIVYCFSRKEAEALAQALRERGVKAGPYHGEMEAATRSQVHSKWTSNQYQVVVATVAFGMGIDKADVRFVIHHSLSKSMENYYQESGRAGRDDKPAFCILYYRLPDVFRQSTMVCVEKTGLENLYAMLGFCLNLVDCRRNQIADHFGEAWDPSWCQGNCDICAGNSKKVESGDVTEWARKAVEIAREAAGKKERITGSKLVEIWMKKSASSRSSAERLIGCLLLEGYLKEDFHFTPYSIISYMVPGRKADLLKGDHKVEITVARESAKGPPEKKKRKLTERKKPPSKEILIDSD